VLFSGHYAPPPRVTAVLTSNTTDEFFLVLNILCLLYNALIFNKCQYIYIAEHIPDEGVSATARFALSLTAPSGSHVGLLPPALSTGSLGQTSRFPEDEGII